MDGVINVLKPPGMTSHDVISFLRRELSQKRIGHAGTLDPEAAGVLPVCVGQATRLIEYITPDEKEYLCELTLGTTTVTQDAWGAILKQEDPSGITKEEIEQILPQFTGEITQITPNYSAVKVKGVPLYKKARQGEEIEPITREVVIWKLSLIDYLNPRVTLLIKCSKGTYIRTLCHDLGKALKVGGHMSFLLRTQVGDFLLKDSLTLAEIQEQKERVMLPLQTCVNSLPKAILTEEDLTKLKYGQMVKIEKSFREKKDIAIFDQLGIFHAIATFVKDDYQNYLKPKKVLKMV